MTLLKRILLEKRAVIAPLLVVLLANIGVYTLIVYPLQARAAGALDRAAAATNELRAAERDLTAARTLVARKAAADQELATFFQKVLPADLLAARRVTYASLPALAKKTNVRYEERQFEVEAPKPKADLGRLKIHVVLQGDYQSIRQFIFELESAPEFVILDDVTLTQNDPAKPLTLTLELSTYYRLASHAP